MCKLAHTHTPYQSYCTRVWAHLIQRICNWNVGVDHNPTLCNCVSQCASQSNTVYHNVYQSNTPPTSSVIATFQGQQGAERLQKDNFFDLVVTGRLFAKHVFMSTLSHVFCLSIYRLSIIHKQKRSVSIIGKMHSSKEREEL